MAEDLTRATGTKEEQYKALIPQVKALIDYESDFVANMANLAAALKEQFDFFWVGFCLVKDEQLVLGPFQGPVACTRIAHNRGVCGTAWAKAETIIVPDVDAFPGHIACSSLSRSEIVLPVMHEGNCIGVLDVDSADLNSFDEVDAKYLQEMITILTAASKL